MSENTLMTLQEVAALLRQEREKQGISQKEMGKITGYHWRTIQNAEIGTASIEVYKVIASALGYEILEDYHLIRTN